MNKCTPLVLMTIILLIPGGFGGATTPYIAIRFPMILCIYILCIKWSSQTLLELKGVLKRSIIVLLYTIHYILLALSTILILIIPMSIIQHGVLQIIIFNSLVMFNLMVEYINKRLTIK